MNKKFVEKVLKAYLEIRRFSSPFIFKKMYKIPIDHYVWDRIKSYSMKEFSKEINLYPYKWESMYGLFDASFPSNCPDYFFQDLKKGRDCDDFARIWRIWAEYNRMTAWEYVFLDTESPFKTAHVVCIAKEKENKYWLFNYTEYGPFSTLDDAINELKKRYYKDKENIIYARYKHEKEFISQ